MNYLNSMLASENDKPQPAIPDLKMPTYHPSTFNHQPFKGTTSDKLSNVLFEGG